MWYRKAFSITKMLPRKGGPSLKNQLAILWTAPEVVPFVVFYAGRPDWIGGWP
jgi:hypothetical protein